MKIGILGLGSIGLRHARNLQMLGHEVIGYDIDEKKQKEFQGKIYDRPVSGNIIGNQEVDAYIIATPTNHHYRDLLDCVAAKPTFIEKPLVALKDYSSLLQLHDLNPIYKSFIGYMLRMHPCVKAAKNWIDSGLIGKPLWANFICGQFNDRPDYLRDGVVLNWSHEIDLALYLLGPAKVVTASVHLTEGKDDIADFVLEHESGARSTIHLDYVTKNEIRESWIVGSEKNLGLDMLGRRISFGKMVQEFGGDWNADYIDEMAAFVEFALGRHEIDITKGPPVQFANSEDGLRVLEICCEVRKMAGLE